jgi:hypothetical protein
MSYRSDLLSRRELIRMLFGCGACAVSFLPGFAFAEGLIPQRPSARVIVDNDFAGDPDGLAALAHQLLTPKTKTVLVTSSFLSDLAPLGLAKGKTAEAGRLVASKLIDLVGMTSPPPVIGGTEGPGLSGPGAAAKAIVAEALRQDKLPLFITCGGPLTNVAMALKMEPSIAKRVTLVWIGGGNYPDGGWEYNMAADPEAARFVFEDSMVPLWQVPQAAYRQCQFSIAELTEVMRPMSPLTEWLYDRFTTPPPWVELGGAWPLGDSPLVLLTALSTESSTCSVRTTPRIDSKFKYVPNPTGRMISVYERLDTRLLFADFIALLRQHARLSSHK